MGYREMLDIWLLGAANRFRPASPREPKKTDDYEEQAILPNFSQRKLPLLPSNYADPHAPKMILAPGATKEGYYIIHELRDGVETDAAYRVPWRRYAQTCLGVNFMMQFVLGFWLAQDQFFTVRSGRAMNMPNASLHPFWILLAMTFQGISTVVEALYALVLLRPIGKKWRPRLRLQGTDLPRVDVVLPVCREALDVIQDTVMGILHLDYPLDKLRVVISDDGGSDALSNWANELRKEYPDLHYTARREHERKGFKAGNLNHAFAFLDVLPGGRAEFAGGLDADMIPEKPWLRSVMAHVVQDSKLGLACPSQRFYNIPENDPLHQAQTTSWANRDIARDLAGTAWNTGSGWVVRRQAVDDIGGFAEDCLIEDVYSSIRMMAEGWNTAYLSEALQYGLVPETYATHIKQFTRWNIGGCQLFIKMGFFLSPSKTKHLSLPQRLYGFDGGFGSIFKPLILTGKLLVLPIMLGSGWPILFYENEHHLRLLVRMQCLIGLAEWVSIMHEGIVTRYQPAIRDRHCIYVLPYNALSILRTFLLPTWLGGLQPNFTATGSLSKLVVERDIGERANLKRRLYHYIFVSGGWFHISVIVSILTAVAIRVTSMINDRRENSTQDVFDHKQMIDFITTLGWGYPSWVMFVLDLATPIMYVLNPPTVPPRSELLEKRQGARTRRPKPEFKDTKWEWNHARLPVWYHLVVTYTITVFVATWWL